MEQHGIVTSYDSFEEMQADMRARHAAAQARVTPTQAAIKPGDYAINVTHLDSEIGPIYGVLQSVEECRAWHELYYGIGDAKANLEVLADRGVFKPPSDPFDPATMAWREDGFQSPREAVEYYVGMLLEGARNGYLMGWWSSAVEDGELGDGHVSALIPISREVYEDAAANHWKVSMAHAEEISHTIALVRAEHQAKEGGGDADSR